MLLEDEEYYSKPQKKQDARENIKSFWFNLFKEQQGTVYGNLTDRRKQVMMLLYQELSTFDGKVRRDMKTTFNTDRSRYWREYSKLYGKRKAKKKPLQVKILEKEVNNLIDRKKNNQDIIKEQERKKEALGKQNKDMEEKQHTIRQEQISYIAQQGFLQSFADKNFYSSSTTAILNIQATISNYFTNASKTNFKDCDKKFMVDLLEKYAQLLGAIGIDKLMQLQPQALTLFLQQNNENNINNNIVSKAMEVKDAFLKKYEKKIDDTFNLDDK